MGQYTGKFGGIKYNDSKVNTAKDRLNAAKKELDDTRSAMAQGFTSLQSCRGIEHIQADLGHNKGVILGGDSIVINDVHGWMGWNHDYQYPDYIFMQCAC